MDRVMVDLAGCSGTEPPYLMVSSTSLQGLMVLREFDLNVIAKRRSEDLRKEFSRLEGLKRRITVQIGLRDRTRRKRLVEEDNGRQKRCKV